MPYFPWDLLLLELIDELYHCTPCTGYTRRMQVAMINSELSMQEAYFTVKLRDAPDYHTTLT